MSIIYWMCAWDWAGDEVCIFVGEWMFDCTYYVAGWGGEGRQTKDKEGRQDHLGLGDCQRQQTSVDKKVSHWSLIADYENIPN